MQGPYASEMVEVPNEADDYGPIDSIHYKGGPISQKDHTEFRRQNFTDGHKLVIRKKKDGNDESESDNGDESDTRLSTKRRVTAKHTARVRDDSQKNTSTNDVCNVLDSAEDSHGIPITVKKKTRISSKTSDGVTWRGTKILSITKLLEDTFGESRNGRIRVQLNAPKRQLRMKALLIDIFKCSTELELLALLQNSTDEHFRFLFYYKSEGYLYSCINPDGLCGPRNFAVLQKGK